MRTLLVLLFCLCAVAMSQMTFTDQWSKRSAPADPILFRPTSGSSVCGRRAVEEMLLQLTQLQAVQREIVAELNSCSFIKRP
ncbi:hypothetical protein Q1695_004963 [Nippostrongylus brasiliensis]|nr:hypothetical protein Q1695_004963 [Nippostrongylus brasiliensis]